MASEKVSTVKNRIIKQGNATKLLGNNDYNALVDSYANALRYNKGEIEKTKEYKSALEKYTNEIKRNRKENTGSTVLLKASDNLAKAKKNNKYTAEDLAYLAAKNDRKTNYNLGQRALADTVSLLNSGMQGFLALPTAAINMADKGIAKALNVTGIDKTIDAEDMPLNNLFQTAKQNQEELQNTLNNTGLRNQSTAMNIADTITSGVGSTLSLGAAGNIGNALGSATGLSTKLTGIADGLVNAGKIKQGKAIYNIINGIPSSVGMTAMLFPSAYEEDIEKGYSTSRAIIDGLAKSIAGGTIENIGGITPQNIFKGTAFTGIGRTLQTIVEEGSEEFIEAIVDGVIDATENVAYGTEQRKLEDVAIEAVQSALMSVPTTLLLGMGTNIATRNQIKALTDTTNISKKDAKQIVNNAIDNNTSIGEEIINLYTKNNQESAKAMEDAKQQASDIDNQYGDIDLNKEGQIEQQIIDEQNRQEELQKQQEEIKQQEEVEKQRQEEIDKNTPSIEDQILEQMSPNPLEEDILKTMGSTKKEKVVKEKPIKEKQPKTLNKSNNIKKEISTKLEDNLRKNKKGNGYETRKGTIIYNNNGTLSSTNNQGKEIKLKEGQKIKSITRTKDETIVDALVRQGLISQSVFDKITAVTSDKNEQLRLALSVLENPSNSNVKILNINNGEDIKILDTNAIEDGEVNDILAGRTYKEVMDEYDNKINLKKQQEKEEKARIKEQELLEEQQLKEQEKAELKAENDRLKAEQKKIDDEYNKQRQKEKDAQKKRDEKIRNQELASLQKKNNALNKKSTTVQTTQQDSEAWGQRILNSYNTIEDRLNSTREISKKMNTIDVQLKMYDNYLAAGNKPIQELENAKAILEERKNEILRPKPKQEEFAPEAREHKKASKNDMLQFADTEYNSYIQSGISSHKEKAINWYKEYRANGGKKDTQLTQNIEALIKAEQDKVKNDFRKNLFIKMQQVNKTEDTITNREEFRDNQNKIVSKQNIETYKVEYTTATKENSYTSKDVDRFPVSEYTEPLLREANKLRMRINDGNDMLLQSLINISDMTGITFHLGNSQTLSKVETARMEPLIQQALNKKKITDKKATKLRQQNTTEFFNKVGGFSTGDSKTIFINIETTAVDTRIGLISHELKHQLEKVMANSSLNKALKSYIDNKRMKEGLNTRTEYAKDLKAIEGRYEDKVFKKKALINELYAEYLRDFITDNTTAITLAKENEKVFSGLSSIIRELSYRANNDLDNAAYERVMRKLYKAMKQASNKNSSTYKYDYNDIEYKTSPYYLVNTNEFDNAAQADAKEEEKQVYKGNALDKIKVKLLNKFAPLEKLDKIKSRQTGVETHEIAEKNAMYESSYAQGQTSINQYQMGLKGEFLGKSVDTILAPIEMLSADKQQIVSKYLRLQSDLERKISGRLNNTEYNSEYYDYTENQLQALVNDLKTRYPLLTTIGDNVMKDLNNFNHNQNVMKINTGILAKETNVSEEFAKNKMNLSNEYINEHSNSDGSVSVNTIDFLDKFNTYYTHAERHIPQEDVESITNQTQSNVGVNKTKGITSRGRNLDLYSIGIGVRNGVMEDMHRIRQQELFSSIGEMFDTKASELSKYGLDELLEQHDGIMLDKNSGKAYIGYYKNGKYYRQQVASAIYDVFTPYTNDIVNWMNNSKEGQKLTKVLKKNSEILREAYTGINSGGYFIKNKIMDTLDYMYSADNGIQNTAKYSMTYVKDIQNNDPTYILFRSLGLDSQFKGYDTKNKTLNKQETNKFKKGLNYMEELNAHVEASTRYIAFKSVYEQTHDTQKALLAAKESTTNFGKTGSIANTLDRQGITIYFGSSIAGLNKAIETNITKISDGIWAAVDGMKNKRLTQYDKSCLKKMGIQLAKMAAYGIGEGILRRLLDDDDDTYNLLPSYIKDNNYIIPLGDGEYLSIPRGRMLSIPYSLNNLFASDISDVDKKSIAETLNYIWDRVGINDLDSSLSFNTFYQLIKNENSYGYKIVDEDDSLSDKTKTRIRYVFDNYGGMIADIVDMGLDTKKGKDIKIPVLKTYYGDAKSNTNSQARYWEYVNKYQNSKDLKDKLTYQSLYYDYVKNISPLKKELDVALANNNIEEAKLLRSQITNLYVQMLSNVEEPKIDINGDGSVISYRGYIYELETDEYGKQSYHKQ